MGGSFGNENEHENSVEDYEEEDEESGSTGNHFNKEYASLANYNRVLNNGNHHNIGIQQPAHHQALLSLPTDIQSYTPEDLINSGIQQPSK